jgi:hypothetical protein
LAVIEEMDSGGRCLTSDVLGEGDGRPIDQIGALGEADRPPGTPVHRDGMVWVNEANRLCRLLRVEMALTEGGPPASDWHQGNVDRRHLPEPEVWTSVPRIPAAARALDKIAKRRSTMSAPGVSPAVVVGSQHAYL